MLRLLIFDVQLKVNKQIVDKFSGFEFNSIKCYTIYGCIHPATLHWSAYVYEYRVLKSQKLDKIETELRSLNVLITISSSGIE